MSTKLQDLRKSIDETRIITAILLHEERINNNTFDMIHDRIKKIELNVLNANDLFKELTEKLTPIKRILNNSTLQREGWEGMQGDYLITILKVQ